MLTIYNVVNTMDRDERQVMRLTFTAHFVICLAVAAGAFFAYRAGALAAVWRADQSMMTSVIAGLFLLTAAVLGREAWRADNPGTVVSPISGKVWDHKAQKWGAPSARADFGHLAMLLSPALGMLGTVLGLSLQGQALMNGAAAFGALGTSLYSTGAGVSGLIAAALMTFNLESGMRRGGR